MGLRRNHDPLVTVATVTYNSAEFVADAIDSVLAQEFRDFELIVCDDCSSDGTWDIVRRYSQPHMRAERHAANVGEYLNRNHVLGLARGKYIIYIDGDDILCPGALGSMVEALENHAGAAFASAQPKSGKFTYPVSLDPHQFVSCIFLGPVIIGANFTQLMFRTEELRAIGGFDLRFRTGDTHVQLLLGMKAGCVLISDGLARWRERPGQASRSLHRDRWGVAEMMRYGVEVLEDPACPLSPRDRRIGRENLARMTLRAMFECMLDGRFLHALRLGRFAGLKLRDAPCLLRRSQRPYMRGIGDANPENGTS
jgi:glycosyltransferase involved in cell wall biosynthesis